MKNQNDTDQVRENDPALDIQKHKWSFLGPEATPAGEMTKKSIRQGLPLQILQLNMEMLTSVNLTLLSDWPLSIM